MTEVAALAEQYQHHPRWENEWSVVQIWLITHEGGTKITEKDRELAQAIDAPSPAGRRPPKPLPRSLTPTRKRSRSSPMAVRAVTPDHPPAGSSSWIWKTTYLSNAAYTSV